MESHSSRYSFHHSTLIYFTTQCVNSCILYHSTCDFSCFLHRSTCDTLLYCYRRCDVLAESSSRRGAGLAVKARCPLHFNVTAALLDTLGHMQQHIVRIHEKLDTDNFRRRVEAVRTAQTAPGESSVDSLSGKHAPGVMVRDGSRTGRGWVGDEGGGRGGGKGQGEWAECGTSGQEEDDIVSRYRHREVFKYEDVFRVTWPSNDDSAPSELVVGSRDTPGSGDSGRGGTSGLLGTTRFPVCHEFCAPLPPESRMSFTILNLTGQRTRYFQPRAGEETRRLQYLRVRRGSAWSIISCCWGWRCLFAAIVGGHKKKHGAKEMQR